MINSCTEDLVYDVCMHCFKNWKNIIFHRSLVSYDLKFRSVYNFFPREIEKKCKNFVKFVI